MLNVNTILAYSVAQNTGIKTIEDRIMVKEITS